MLLATDVRTDKEPHLQLLPCELLCRGGAAQGFGGGRGRFAGRALRQSPASRHQEHHCAAMGTAWSRAGAPAAAGVLIGGLAAASVYRAWIRQNRPLVTGKLDSWRASKFKLQDGHPARDAQLHALRSWGSTCRSAETTLAKLCAEIDPVSVRGWLPRLPPMPWQASRPRPPSRADVSARRPRLDARTRGRCCMCGPPRPRLQLVASLQGTWRQVLGSWRSTRSTTRSRPMTGFCALCRSRRFGGTWCSVSQAARGLA